MKEFNTTATCIPRMHYMVDISEKLDQIERMIIGGKYFTINRSRQYGKTTTFAALFRRLREEYIIIHLSFEGLGDDAFSSDKAFVANFINMVAENWEVLDYPEEQMKDWMDLSPLSKDEIYDAFDILSRKITRLCKLSSS